MDPWRRLSGLTTLRTQLQYAIARELWMERDAIAQRRDRPPTWILPTRRSSASPPSIGTPFRPGTRPSNCVGSGHRPVSGS
ncbi:hypothetical protein G7085_00370 [Tessaracoccus sp. HDW20]|nr:hypothetical protein [Tessaracoccus coleopterorum]